MRRKETVKRESQLGQGASEIDRELHEKEAELQEKRVQFDSKRKNPLFNNAVVANETDSFS